MKAFWGAARAVLVCGHGLGNCSWHTLSLQTWDPQHITAAAHWGQVQNSKGALARENDFFPVELVLTALAHFPASSPNVSFCCPEAHGQVPF